MKLKTKEQIESMREGGGILARILRELVAMAKPGVVTMNIDRRARELMREQHVQPSFLGYQNYPAVVCTSVNDEAVHAIPSDREIKEGDLLKLDLGVIHKGLHTDTAVTVLVGGKPRQLLSGLRPQASEEKIKLINVTREALYAGISKARVGNTLGDIGAEIQRVVEKNGFQILKELGGHGIGEKLHEDPFVANYGDRRTGAKLAEGMALAIEPITAVSTWKIKDSQDGFGFLTKDGSLSAHFEHTVIVTEKGPIVVTE